MSEKQTNNSKETIAQSNDAQKATKQASKSKSGTNTPTEPKTSKTTSKKAQNTPSKKTPSKVTNINSKPKKLTLAAINKASSKFNEKKKVYINVEGELAEVMVNVHFRKSEVENACLEYLELIIQSLRIEGINKEDIMKNIENLYWTFILKKFTNLPIPQIDDISKLLGITINLYDLKILDQFSSYENDLISVENIKLIEEIFNKVISNLGQVVSDGVLSGEIGKLAENYIDVDDYFAELEARNFEITEDEDLDLLIKVLNQLEADGTYDEYMKKLDSSEIEMLNERMKLIAKRKIESGEEVGEDV